MHNLIHTLWAGLKNLLRDEAVKQMGILKNAHDIIVAEFASRGGDNHPTPLEKTEDELKSISGLDYFETFKSLHPWQIEDAGIIVRVLQKYFCKTVLDVGCGVGWLLALLQGWFEPTGIEPSEVAVEAGQRAHFNIYRGYGESMPFVDSFFDGVITNHVLEHVEDPIMLINECSRVSRRVSIHIVSIGKRKDTMHINEYHTLEELRELGNEIVFPVKFDKTVYNNGIIIVSKTIRPIGIFKDYSDIMLIPDYVAQVGESVSQEEIPTKDFEIMVKKANISRLLEAEVLKRLKEGYSDKVKWIYQAEGPTGASSSLFDLVLRSKEVMITKENAANKTFLQKFGIPKPAQIFHLYKDKNIALMWEKWCDERKVVNVELKYKGFRAIIEKNAEGKTLIFFEGSSEDRSKQFPMLVKEMQKINAPFIFDCDFSAVGTGEERLNEIDLQYLKDVKNVVEEEYTRSLRKEAKAKLKVTVCDVLYYGKAVAHLAFSERRKILDSISFENFKLFDKSKVITVRTKDVFVSIVREHLKKDYSDGVIVKDLTGQYIGFDSCNIYCVKGKLFTCVHSDASDDIKGVRSGLILTKSKHSREKCMRCDKSPIYECLWAEGIGHAWFCKEHLKWWIGENEVHSGGFSDVDSIKEIKDGVAAKKYGDNSNPNILEELKAELKKK